MREAIKLIEEALNILDDINQPNVYTALDRANEDMTQHEMLDYLFMNDYLDVDEITYYLKNTSVMIDRYDRLKELMND